MVIERRKNWLKIDKILDRINFVSENIIESLNNEEGNIFSIFIRLWKCVVYVEN